MPTTCSRDTRRARQVRIAQNNAAESRDGIKGGLNGDARQRQTDRQTPDAATWSVTVP